MSGSHIANVRCKLCAGCEGYLRPEDQQCPHCGRLDTISFDSHAEMKRWGELRLLEKCGQIADLIRQPRFELLVDGTKIGAYVADFVYRDDVDRKVVEDVKGGNASSFVDTPLSAWKRKHYEAQYGATISIIAR